MQFALAVLLVSNMVSTAAAAGAAAAAAAAGAAATAPSTPSIVRTFDELRNQPYTVTYDNRSLLLDDKRVLLLGGSFHYPRAPPEEWRSIMQAMKADGLNHLQMYTFWNVHEQQRSKYDFSDASRANLTRFLATAAEVGLFVNVRLGPFVCAEWNFGGLPVWLRNLPNVVFRDNNAVWKREMAIWIHRVTQEIEPFLARNGGPVMMVQIENEYNSGWFGAWDAVEYIEWTGLLVKNLSLGVPTMMCNGLSATGTLNAFNGGEGSTYAASHAVEYPGQPLLWAEDEMGMGGWGAGNDPNQPQGGAVGVAHSLARWIALGAAHHNYYMWYGGNHVARWAGMAISNSYADTAPMHSDRLPNEPLHSHMSQLHMLLAEHAPTILASPMQQQQSLQRGGGSDPMLVPSSTTALAGTIDCDAEDAAQQFSLLAGAGGGHALTANAIDSHNACVTAMVIKGSASGAIIGTCNSSNADQAFRFSDDAKGQGTLCSDGGLCLCATDPLAARGAYGIPASEQTVSTMNVSAAQSFLGCVWTKTATGQIESMVQPAPPAECTSSMSFYLGKPAQSSHCNSNCIIASGNYTVAEAEKICDDNFVCAGFIYQDTSTNGTAIDCHAVHHIFFQEAVPNSVSADKSWKAFTKHPFAYPYPDPRSKGPHARRCLTSGFASPRCGICDAANKGPCTCAFVYGTGADALAFVQNDGVSETNFSLPGTPTKVLSVAPNSISLVFGGVTIFNSASIEGCTNTDTVGGNGGGASLSCSLPTERRNITIAGNSSSSSGKGASVLSWRRWTEPSVLSKSDVAKATPSQQPLEQLNLTDDKTDYLFYQRKFNLKAEVVGTRTVGTRTVDTAGVTDAPRNATLYIGTRLGSALSIFIDGVLTGANVKLDRPYSSAVVLPIKIGMLSSGDHTLTILSAAIGNSNYPAHGFSGKHGQLPAHGITGDVVLSVGSATNITLTAAPASSPWIHSVGLAGERARVFTGSSGVWSNSSSSVVPSSGGGDMLPLSWFRTMFTVPSSMVALAVAGKASILLDPVGMGRGHFYLNGVDLGRYYPAAPGAVTAGLGGMLYLPPSLLEDKNVLVFGEELGATQPTAVCVILSTLAAPSSSSAGVPFPKKA